MSTPENGDDLYDGYPLVQSMLRHHTTRTLSLKDGGKSQPSYTNGRDGWISSIFIIHGRALDWMVLPWCVVVAHATIYTVVNEVVYKNKMRDMASLEYFVRCGSSKT